MQSSAEKFLSLKDVHLLRGLLVHYTRSLLASASLWRNKQNLEYKLHLVIFINWKVLRQCWYNLV